MRIAKKNEMKAALIITFISLLVFIALGYCMEWYLQDKSFGNHTPI